MKDGSPRSRISNPCSRSAADPPRASRTGTLSGRFLARRHQGDRPEDDPTQSTPRPPRRKRKQGPAERSRDRCGSPGPSRPQVPPIRTEPVQAPISTASACSTLNPVPAIPAMVFAEESRKGDNTKWGPAGHTRRSGRRLATRLAGWVLNPSRTSCG